MTSPYNKIPNTPNICYVSTNKRKVEEIINEKYNDSHVTSTSRDKNNVEENMEVVPEEIPVPSINFDRLSYYKCNKVNLKHIVLSMNCSNIFMMLYH